MKFFARTMLITFLRFILLMSLGLFADSFEVSPLPDWTLSLFTYAVAFGLSFLLAWRIFAAHRPMRGEIITVAVAFLLLETCFEAILFIVLRLYLGLPFLSALWRNYHWSSLLLLLWHLLAVLAATAYAKRRSSRRALPEGMIVR